ncbi:MAG: hypothetical protein JWM05_629 [Acidimicrobiales bacterium]|nr:hypothetical protein [Acidimicrobiales bacterium]
MDLVWYRRARRAGTATRFLDWELSSGVTSFEDAGAPAQVGRHAVRSLTGRDLPPELAGVTNDVVHWSTGISWGVLFGLASGSRCTGIGRGVVLGAVAWATSYAVLPAIGVYQPIWEYDRDTLAQDLTAHLVFGTTTAIIDRVLSPT